jgi:transcriptional regulator with XRE-family HTH domain
MPDQNNFPSDWPTDKKPDAPADRSVRAAKLHVLALAVRSRREALGWSQAELGRRAGLNRNVINTLENEVSFPLRHNVILIADALRVQVSELTSAFVHEDLQRAPASLSITEARGQPDVVLMQVCRRVTTETAARIVALLADDRSEAA